MTVVVYETRISVTVFFHGKIKLCVALTVYLTVGQLINTAASCENA